MKKRALIGKQDRLRCTRVAVIPDGKSHILIQLQIDEQMRRTGYTIDSVEVVDVDGQPRLRVTGSRKNAGRNWTRDNA